jgi:DNA polymerase-3 subunit gamma/tau
MAEGSLRDALSLLEQARAYCGEVIPDKEVRELLGVVPEDSLNELVAAIAEGSAERALGLVHTFQKDGRNLQHFCREAIRHMRNLLIAGVCGADSDLIAATADQRPALAKAAAQFSEEDLTRFFQILLQTDDDLRRKPDARVHLEMGLLRLINAQRLAPMEELLAELRTGAPASAASSVTPRAGSASAAVASSRPAAPSGFSSASQKTFAPSMRSAAPALVATAAAAAPARAEAHPNAAADSQARVAAAPASEPVAEPIIENSSEARADGITQEQVSEIKAAVQAQQKFLGEIVQHGSRWELEGAELRIYFSPEKRAFAELMEGRDSLEKVRISSSKVLGRPVRVCAKVEAVAAAAPLETPDARQLRERFERDPMVQSMLQRFGGRISEVKWRQEES